MLLGFPLIDKTQLARDFSTSNFIGIIDVESGNKNIIPIEKDCKNYQALFGNNLFGVVSPFFSFLSLRVFNENGINTFKAESQMLDENVELFHAGKIQKFNARDVFTGGACSGTCQTCSTDDCK